MMMVLGRKHVLATTKGHMIRFEKDEPTFVPPICVPDAVAIGASPVEGQKMPDLIQDEAVVNVGPVDPTEREKEMQSAIDKLVRANARKDFTAAGLPSTDAMTRVLGYDVSAAERNTAWQLYSNLKAQAEAEA